MNVMQGDYIAGGVRILDGKYKDAILKLKSEEKLVIGRDAKVSHLVLEAPWVSRKHCEIIYDNQERTYYVTDYSENGTFIKSGNRLEREEAHCLASGTIITIGEEGISMQLM